MDNNWRGRGRGRGRGYSENRRYEEDSGYTINSRLGPISRDNHSNHDNSHYTTNTNHNNNSRNTPSDNSRSFFSNQPRGRGSRGRGNSRSVRSLGDEDIEMDPNDLSRVVIVSGYPVKTEQAVMRFLDRKVKTPWEALDVQFKNDSIWITVADESIADSLCRINNYTFSNMPLSVTKAHTPNKKYRPSDKKTNNLTEYIQELWTPDTGYLNLQSLQFKSHSIVAVFNRVLECASQLYGNKVKTLSVAGNNLWSVGPITKIADYFPDLENLSIADNQIAEFKSLDRLSNKLPHLRELMLSGNPIQTSHDADTYKREIIHRFPSVVFLDGMPLHTPAQTITTVKPDFFDSENTRLITLDLLSKYYPLFDTNRSALVDLYHPTAIFSSVFSKGTFDQQKTWGSGKVPTSQRMTIGNENIIKRLLSLPTTAHDLSSPDKYMTDAWQTVHGVTAMLFITVHGEFTDLHTGTVLSFDRAVLVEPSYVGSRAHSAGWSYVVLSDLLTVREYSGKPTQLMT